MCLGFNVEIKYNYCIVSRLYWYCVCRSNSSDIYFLFLIEGIKKGGRVLAHLGLTFTCKHVCRLKRKSLRRTTFE